MIDFKRQTSQFLQMIQFYQAKLADAERIESLARPIWQAHYTPIIGAEQVEYMLNKFQSSAAVVEQLTNGYQYTVVIADNQDAGYIATEVREGTLFISKFYLHQDFRGQGLGRQMLNHIDSLAKASNCGELELTVNKYNPAYQAYLALGFNKVESIVMDIGNGYVMDDYRMKKPVAN